MPVAAPEKIEAKRRVLGLVADLAGLQARSHPSDKFPQQRRQRDSAGDIHVTDRPAI